MDYISCFLGPGVVKNIFILKEPTYNYVLSDTSVSPGSSEHQFWNAVPVSKILASKLHVLFCLILSYWLVYLSAVNLYLLKLEGYREILV